MSGLAEIPELTTWTRDGTVDLVSVRRFLNREPGPQLTAAERRVVAHLLLEAGFGPGHIGDRLHVNHKHIKQELARPAPVDRRGRTITTGGTHVG